MVVWNNVDQAKNKFCRQRLRAQEITKMSRILEKTEEIMGDTNNRGDH